MNTCTACGVLRCVQVRQGIAAARTAAKSQGRPSPKPLQQQQEHAAATAPQQGSGTGSKARGSQSSSPAVRQQAGQQQVSAATSRKAATTPWSQLPADEAASKVAAATARYKAMAAIMTPEQQQIEEKWVAWLSACLLSCCTYCILHCALHMDGQHVWLWRQKASISFD
jgi:hypothetical protein